MEDFWVENGYTELTPTCLVTQWHMLRRKQCLHNTKNSNFKPLKLFLSLFLKNMFKLLFWLRVKISIDLRGEQIIKSIFWCLKPLPQIRVRKSQALDVFPSLHPTKTSFHGFASDILTQTSQAWTPKLRGTKSSKNSKLKKQVGPFTKRLLHVFCYLNKDE